VPTSKIKYLGDWQQSLFSFLLPFNINN